MTEGYILFTKGTVQEFISYFSLQSQRFTALLIAFHRLEHQRTVSALKVMPHGTKKQLLVKILCEVADSGIHVFLSIVLCKVNSGETPIISKCLQILLL